MTDTRDFLFELGTEELPPKALKRLSDALTNGIVDGLDKARLSHGEVKSYAAPRRLAVWIKDLQIAQPDQKMQRKGPAKKAAFDADGNPTKAAEGFARSCGVTVADLQELDTPKGIWLVYDVEQKGQAASELLPGIVDTSLARLPIPKRMRWGALSVEFVRPVHWVAMLLGDEVVDTEILGQKAGNSTRGHRFHNPADLTITSPSAYGELLASEGYVVADFEQRREQVRTAVVEAAQANGGTAVIDEDLLDEVTALVEWPVAIVGEFEDRFLDVPHECLISAMKGHQKYFHMVDDNGTLMPNFITLSNLDSPNPEVIKEGNERVIRPRLTDAVFFWEQDKKVSLADRREQLKTVVFQKQLGTVYDKSERVAALAADIASQTGGDADKARLAAQLAKSDLLTDMVGEFPDLQGLMGRYYAQHENQDAEVAQALEEQYLPRFAGDVLPATGTGRAVSLADKLDTLVGIFGIGQKPTGDKDPFALRRAALGVLRMLMDQDLDLRALIQAAQKQLGEKISSENVDVDVFHFMKERLRGLYTDQGVTADVFDAVSHAPMPKFSLKDFDSRIKAVQEFQKNEAAESLAAANKRIQNLLKKVEGEKPETVDVNLFEEDSETKLHSLLVDMTTEVRGEIDAGSYSEALTRLASLRESVDSFFEDVMVMADDEAVRNNRLALLNGLGDLFLAVADISRLQS